VVRLQYRALSAAEANNNTMTGTDIYFYPVIAFGIALLVHYMVISLSHRKGLFLDEQEKIQKAHQHPTPRIGGLGVFLSVLFIAKEQTLGIYLILAAIPAFLSGFIEDYSGKVSPLIRLVIMSLAPVMAVLLIPGGIVMRWGNIEMAWYAGVLITLLLSVALSNGVNFVDGQNGLAGGSMLLTFISVGILSWIYDDSVLFYIALVFTAGILAFLLFNYPVAGIFLGDSGAYLLGFLATITTMLLAGRHPGLSPVLPAALLIYPLWEVCFSTLRKLFYDHISPFRSDRNHLHQLVFRHYASGKGYLPAILLLPAQAALSALAVIFAHSTYWLLLLLAAFIILYCCVYFYERTFAAKNEHSIAVP